MKIVTLDETEFFKYMMYCNTVCMRDEGKLMFKLSDEELLKCKKQAERCVEVYFNANN